MQESESPEDVVRRALHEAPFALRQLAAESGLSYDGLRSWRSGRRRPSRTSIRRLAAGLASRSARMDALVVELRALD